MNYDGYGPKYTIEQLESNLSLESILAEYSGSRNSRDTADSYPGYGHGAQLSMEEAVRPKTFINIQERQVSSDEPEETYDPSVYTGGKSRHSSGGYSYDGQEISSSSDDDYLPAEQPDYSDYYGDEEADDELPRVSRSEKRIQRQREKMSTPEDPDRFVKENERRFSRLEQEEHDDIEQDVDTGFFPRSFGEFLSSGISGLLYRVGTPSGRSSSNVRVHEEDLGKEVSPIFASKYYRAYLQSAEFRLKVSFVLLVVILWISLGLPVTGKLKANNVAGLVCMGNQFLIMLLGLDIVTNAVTRCFNMRPGADTLAVLSCIFTGFDALIVARTGFTVNHLPLCALSSLSFVGVMWSSVLTAKALRKATRVPAIGKTVYSVTSEIRGKESSLLKSNRPFAGFIRRAEEAAPDEAVYEKLFVPVILFAFLFSFITALIKHAFSELIFIFSAYLCAGVPFCSLLCFALSYYEGSMRIFQSGAAIAGWSGAVDIGRSNNLIVTDCDLFPADSITIENVRVFANANPDKVIAYAGTLIEAVGCVCAKCFTDLMAERNVSAYKLESLELLPGGGIRGILDGHTVIVGNSDISRLMKISIPSRLVNSQSVLLAVDGTLYSIFSLHYEALPKVKQSLVSLIGSNRHPIFATRDFNITPEMLSETFDLRTDGYDFPPYTDRFEISESDTGEFSEISAVVCREGLRPLVHTCDTGRKIYVSSLVCLALTVFCTVFTMLYVLICLTGSGVLSITALIIISVIFSLPVLIVSKLLPF